MIMKEYGVDGVWDDKLVVRNVRAIVRDAIGQASLDQLNSNRATYEVKIQGTLNNLLAKNGIRITQFNIANIGVPQAIKDAVLAKETARQNADKAVYLVQQAEQEAKIEVTKASGIAKANEILASSLTDKLVRYKELDIQKEQIEKWNGQMPSTVVGSGTNSLLNIK
jgi:regulator of protease activity HflC (stomatin/prohibitin superfamily)